LRRDPLRGSPARRACAAGEMQRIGKIDITADAH
jgi:hypothetical protein